MNSRFWLYFIVLQPFLDVATNFMVKYSEMPITIGIVVRMGMLLAAFAVAMLYFKRENLRKMMAANLLLYGFLAVSLAINFAMKDSFNLMAEVQFMAKAAYPFQLFFVFYVLLTEQKLKRQQLVKFLTWNLILLSLFVILPSELGMAFESYGADYEGTIGWFNSANEVGAAVGFLLPIVIWGLYKEYVKWSGVIAVVLASYTAYLVGTKVSLGSVLLILTVSVIFIAVKNRFRFDKALVSIVVPMIFLFAGFEQSPAMNNVEAVEETLVQKEQSYENKEANYTPEQVVAVTEVERLKQKSHPLLTQFLSSRDVYVLMHAEYFQKAELPRQLFGLGYASEYPKTAKVTEMDFFDYFYSFGIIGTLLTLALLTKPMIVAVKRIWSSIKEKRFSDFDYFLFFAVGLLLGISFIAGHVIFTPSVSIYLALGFALLVVGKGTEKKNSY